MKPIPTYSTQTFQPFDWWKKYAYHVHNMKLKEDEDEDSLHEASKEFLFHLWLRSYHMVEYINQDLEQYNATFKPNESYIEFVLHGTLFFYDDENCALFKMRHL